MFRAEIYKFYNSLMPYLYFFIIILYVLFGNLLYYFSSINIDLLYLNFIEEFIILYLVISLFYSSSAFCDEYNYYIMPFIKAKKVITSKLICLIIIIFLSLTVSFVFSNFITLIFFRKSFFTLDIILGILKTFLKKMPMIMIINLICLFCSSIFSKSSTSLIISYLTYGLSSYLNKFIIIKNITILKYIPNLIWDFNNILLNQNKYICVLINFFCVLFLFFLIKLVIKNRKN